MHSCLVGCRFAQLDYLFRVLDFPIGQQKDLFILWNSLFNVNHVLGILFSNWSHNPASFYLRILTSNILVVIFLQELVDGIFQGFENLSALHVCTHLVDLSTNFLDILVVVKQTLFIMRGQRVAGTERYDLEETTGR